MLRREGWVVNGKRVWRLYVEEGLSLRRRRRRRRASVVRVPLAVASRPNERWSMDFVHDSLQNGRAIRILTVVDQFSRESVCVEADFAMSGKKVARALEAISKTRPMPLAITVDNGAEFAGKDLDMWAYWKKVKLDFIRPGKPVENAYIESFNGRLRQECLNQELFESIEDAKKKLEAWREDYNERRPHSSLGNLTPREFVQLRSEKPTEKLENLNLQLG